MSEREIAVGLHLGNKPTELINATYYQYPALEVIGPLHTQRHFFLMMHSAVSDRYISVSTTDVVMSPSERRDSLTFFE